MQTRFDKLAIMVLAIALTGCASNKLLNQAEVLQPAGSEQKQEGQLTPIAGPAIGLNTMDADDQNKMSHALDQGLGKTSTWSNQRTGITYAVVPVAKVTYQGNTFCRKYTATVTKQASRRSMSGTACVSGTDASWRVVN